MEIDIKNKKIYISMNYMKIYNLSDTNIYNIIDKIIDKLINSLNEIDDNNIIEINIDMNYMEINKEKNYDRI